MRKKQNDDKDKKKERSSEKVPIASEDVVDLDKENVVCVLPLASPYVLTNITTGKHPRTNPTRKTQTVHTTRQTNPKFFSRK